MHVPACACPHAATSLLPRNCGFLIAELANISHYPHRLGSAWQDRENRLVYFAGSGTRQCLVEGRRLGQVGTTTKTGRIVRRAITW